MCSLYPDNAICIRPKNGYILWGTTHACGDGAFSANPGEIVCGPEIRFNGSYGAIYVAGWKYQACNPAHDNWDVQWSAFDIWVDPSVENDVVYGIVTDQQGGSANLFIRIEDPALWADSDSTLVDDEGSYTACGPQDLTWVSNSIAQR